MTIDEAIKNHKYEAKKCREEIIKAEYLEPQEKYYNSQCVRLAEEHEQLAEWLEELKANKVTSAETYESGYKRGYGEGYTKGIDDFANELENHSICADTGKGNTEKMEFVAPITRIREVAEQLKGGVVE